MTQANRMVWPPKDGSSDAHRSLTTQESALVRSLLYADIFKYPLTVNELARRTSDPSLTPDRVTKVLEQLCEEGCVHQWGDFYSIQNDPSLRERRLKGNRMADERRPKAFQIARWIHSFPFVRSVMISGSLSKDYMDEKSDLDFFLITESGRLWLVKGLMVLVKKLWFGGSYRDFCVNYLIDQDHLLIEEQNLFTATELITVRPVTGKALYEEFWQANPWMHTFYPLALPHTCHQAHDKEGKRKRLAEWLLSGWLGGYIDRRSMRVFQRRIARRYEAQYSKKDLRVAFKTKEHVSKYHEKNFQRRVLDRFEASIREYETQHQVKLTS